MCAGVFLLLLHPREREGKEYIKSSAELVFILVVQAFYSEKKEKKIFKCELKAFDLI